MNNDIPIKPLGKKCYGSIPHLIGSRRGPADIGVPEGQHNICTLKTRDKHDTVIVQLKLDGSNVAVGKLNGKIIAMNRAGYLASTSPFKQHRMFDDWVSVRNSDFADVLHDGEWLSGEWLAQAHGTRYDLCNSGLSPFVAFDLWVDGGRRLNYDSFMDRISGMFTTPPLLHIGRACPIEDAMHAARGRLYGELDEPEGAVWRVERMNHKTKQVMVDFLAKYVRPDKIDGKYLPEISGNEPIWNLSIGARQ